MYKVQKNFTLAEIATKAARTGLSPFKKGNTYQMNLAKGIAIQNLKKSSTASTTGLSIDQQIFQDVYTAEDLVLQTATKFIEGPKPFDEEKYDRLKKLAALGFNNAQEVKDVEEYDKKLEDQIRLVKQVEEYQRLYPMHKFIDPDGVEQLCKKYGLLLTAVDKYKGEIPNKNQVEIVNYRVRKNHIRKPSELNNNLISFYDFVNIGSRRFDDNRTVKSNPYYWTEKLPEEKAYQNLSDEIRRLNTPFVVEEYGIQLHGPKGPIENKGDRVMAMGMAFMAKKALKEQELVNGTDLCILAPERMLITAGNAKKGHILLNDPIILQPVQGGYLIVTSWGLEAGDAAIVNVKHN